MTVMMGDCAEAIGQTVSSSGSLPEAARPIIEGNQVVERSADIHGEKDQGLSPVGRTPQNFLPSTSTIRWDLSNTRALQLWECLQREDGSLR
jgi:hypothetical protein